MLKHILTRAAIILVLFIVHTNPQHFERPTLNGSGDSIRMAKANDMLRYINATSDPCEDFYEFACGNWNKFHSAELSGKLTTGFLESLQDSLDAKLKLLLVTDDVGDSDTDRKVKNCYRSCMKLPSLKPHYPDKLKEIISEFGQMPALAANNWREVNFDWLQTISAISRKYGIFIITGALVSPDLADSSVNRVYIVAQTLTLQSKHLYSDEHESVYLSNLLKVVAINLHSFLGLDVDTAVETAQEIVNFEISLAKCMDDTADLTLSSLDEVQQKYSPYLDFRKLVNLTLAGIPKLKMLFSEYYIENLIKTLQVTPKRVVANYIFYQVLEKFVVYIPDTERELQDTCLSEMKSYFSQNFDNMVYRKYNTAQTEQGANLMWRDIKAAFKESLESPQYDWIGKDTRNYALDKLKAMNMEVVSYKDADFATGYQQLRIDSKDYVENLKSLRILGNIQYRDAITETPRLRAKLSTTPAYALTENAVKVPIALLQPYVAWSAAFPNAFNFGVLGALLSHELIHGFDDRGRHYDLQGNSLEWWDENSTRDFNERSQCFNEQYQRFIYQGKQLRDMPTQSENIADNGGVRLAYAAYLKWYESAAAKDPAGVRESMPGLNFAYKKLFFISYGQLWCGDINPAYRQLQESIDTHVPDKFRVNVPLSNFEEFSAEFNCPKGSGMNPTKRCEIY